jgi:hypothetical protein
MKRLTRGIWGIYLTLVLTVFIVVWTGVIPRWGAWYSNHLTFRWQTEKILKGHLALATDPSGIEWDLAWNNGAVQQIWGLGVPFWRLPFEAFAKAIGRPAFPDRLSFAIALAGVIYLMVRFSLRSFSGVAHESERPWGFLGLFATVLFPPFLALCASLFLVYEEVVAYEFIAGLLLMIWTANVFFRPNSISFLALALASGFAPFIRPTFGVYGMASVAVAGIAFWKMGRYIRLYCLAGALFLVGIGLLLWSNAVRFGSPLEFGHALAVNGFAPMGYATRFDNPYHAEPILSAAKELFGFLFLTRSRIGSDGYGFNLFPGQSSTFRWRELYFSTYDISTFLMVVVVFGWLTWRIYRNFGQKGIAGGLNIFEVVALWSMLASAPLTLFYLRFQFISSRYVLDFGPAFAAALWVFFGLVITWAVSCKYRAKVVQLGLVALLSGWWMYEIATIQIPKGQPGARTWKEVADQMEMDKKRPSHKEIPFSYSNGFAFDKVGINFNGQGWDSTTGRAASCVVVFVENPDCLSLELSPASGLAIPIGNYDCIQAKIGVEYLVRESVTATGKGMRVLFKGPKKKQYQKGVQIASVAMVRPAELSTADSEFRLLNIGWHRELIATNTP